MTPDPSDRDFAHAEYLVLANDDGRLGWVVDEVALTEQDALAAAIVVQAEGRHLVRVVRHLATVSGGVVQRIAHTERLWQSPLAGGGTIDLVPPLAAVVHPEQAEARLLLPVDVGRRLAAHLSRHDAGELLAVLLDSWEHLVGLPLSLASSPHPTKPDGLA